MIMVLSYALFMTVPYYSIFRIGGGALRKKKTRFSPSMEIETISRKYSSAIYFVNFVNATPKSKVWQYFNKHTDRGDCRLCMNVIVSKGGNAANLPAHLRRKHNTESTPHQSVAGKIASP